MLKWIGGLLAIVVIGAAAFFFFVLPAKFEASLNRVVPVEPVTVTPEAEALHKTLRVADLHADTLLWARDPLKRANRGHVDLPRLEEGGHRLQVFSAVTKTPKNLNFERNTGDSDQITLLVIAERWPVRSWGSLAERALYQARRLDKAAAHSNGALKVVRSRAELAEALDSGAVAGILATEGAHPLEGDLANLDRLYDAGYRMMGLQHFFDNELGGSLHGVSGEGLTEFGREAVKAAIERGMIIDLAHSSEAVDRDVLALTDAPIIVSHTGVRGQCDSRRNISDELMQQIAARGGVIGIGFWEGAVCKGSVGAIADAIVYAVNLLGAEHVGLGSDFDGAVTAPIDTAQVAELTQALMDRGLDEESIRLVMGENEIRFFLENLPEN